MSTGKVAVPQWILEKNLQTHHYCSFGKTHFFLTCKHKDNIARVCGKPGEVIQLCFSTSRGNWAVSVSNVLSLMGQILFHLSCFAHQLTLIFHFFLIYVSPTFTFFHPFLLWECSPVVLTLQHLSFVTVILSVKCPLHLCQFSPRVPCASWSDIRGAFGSRCQRLAVLPRLEVSSNSGDPSWERCLCGTEELAVR